MEPYSFIAPPLLRAHSVVSRARHFFHGTSREKARVETLVATFYEDVWRDAARALGASIEDLGNGVFEIRRGPVFTRVKQNCTSIDDLATHRVVRTKPVIHKLLSEAHLPVPRNIALSPFDLDYARAFLELCANPCVVKPAADSGGGCGVTTGVTTFWQLSKAVSAASGGGAEVLLEEQIEGDNYRLLFLDGVLLDAIRRRPPTVKGDGNSTVRALIRAENRARLKDGLTRSHTVVTLDQDLENTLAQAGLTLESIPRAGVVLQLKTAINENNRFENETVTGEISPKVVLACAEAAKIAGARLAGVDIITKDPSAPLGKTGGVILEVNSPPGYYWHYHKKDGTSPIGRNILSALLRRSEPRPPEIALKKQRSVARQQELTQ